MKFLTSIPDWDTTEGHFEELKELSDRVLYEMLEAGNFKEVNHFHGEFVSNVKEDELVSHFDLKLFDYDECVL